MDASLPLPGTTSDLIAHVALAKRHPGLQLDKFVRRTPSQEQRKKSLAEVCQAAGDNDFLKTLLHRRETYLDSIGAVRWRCSTTGPLTLHSTRDSGLENAGIGLHPLYGFVYLPGSSLKGMARAYAETVWLSAQYQVDTTGQAADADQRDKALAAWQLIEAVFGRAPHRDEGKGERKSARLPRRRAEDAAASGCIVFHEAWPEAWPKLELDIANNHHPSYYQCSDSRDAPGDWESPVMSSFLAIGSGNTFCFALSRRGSDVADGLLEQARQWLLGALVYEGAGAKTSAGYGGFKPFEGELPVLAGPSRKVFETTMELVTPAFLAGAKQESDDCRLRTATFRGLLRWWWRTMHAGFVDVATLRRLETAIWGNVNTGGAVRLTIEPQTPLHPLLYDYKERFSPKPDFQRDHQLQPPPNQKTAQGLFYASYGMDDGRPKRYYLAPGARWMVRLTARGSRWESQNARGKPLRSPIPPDVVLQQAKAALWLLTHFGGVGSKARKGFGSFADISCGDVNSLDDCRKAAAAFRSLCGCDGTFHDQLAESLALERVLRLDDIPISWKDYWFSLDQLGYASQAFAQQLRHNRAKLALGLPRQIHGPRPEPFRGQNREHRPPEPLKGPKGDRHASPVFYHLARTAEGALSLRVTAFPAKYLPNQATSAVILGDLLKHLADDLQKRAQQPGPTGLPPPAAAPAKPAAVAAKPVAAPAKPAARPAAPVVLPKAGDHLEAVLVDDPKGRGRRFARHVRSGLVGPILNVERIPPEKNLGDAITLWVYSLSSDGKQVQWRVPTETDKPRSTQPRRGPPPGHSRRR
jgi:CRISPR-associated protein Cmr6